MRTGWRNYCGPDDAPVSAPFVEQPEPAPSNTLKVEASASRKYAHRSHHKCRTGFPGNIRRDNFFTRIFCHLTGTGGLNALFLLNDNAPDFVQDRGHTFGSELPDSEKRALIEYMKTF